MRPWKYVPCQCRSHIHQHIPIDGIVSIVYDYARKKNTRRIGFNLDMSFGVAHVEMFIQNSAFDNFIVMSYLDKMTGDIHKCSYGISHLYDSLLSEVFTTEYWRDLLCAGQVKNANYPYSPIGGNGKKKFTAIVEVMYYILYAEEHNEHLHRRCVT